MLIPVLDRLGFIRRALGVRTVVGGLFRRGLDGREVDFWVDAGLADLLVCGLEPLEPGRSPLRFFGVPPELVADPALAIGSSTPLISFSSSEGESEEESSEFRGTVTACASGEGKDGVAAKEFACFRCPVSGDMAG